MGYLELVPAEHPSGGTVRRRAITKTGSAHAHRPLTESAWNYPFAPRVHNELCTRQRALAQSIRELAWKATVRLCARFPRRCKSGA